MAANKSNSVKITLIIVIGAIILGAIILNSLNPSAQNTVSVAGQSTIHVMPDLVGIYFSVETQSSTIQDASSKNSAIVDNLTNALINDGFSSRDIQTQSYSVYPEYDYSQGTQRLIDYKATHLIRVQLSVNNTEKIGQVVDAGVSAGAGISYINFELSQDNQNKYKAQAIELAAQDAAVKAQAVADGLRKKVGSLVSVSVDNYNYMPWLAVSGAGATPSQVKTEATNIQPSSQDISASVTAVFKIV